MSFAASKSKSSARKASSRSFFGSAAVACLVLGCGWTVYTNVFGASPYPQLGSADFDAPVVRRPQAVAAAANAPQPTATQRDRRDQAAAVIAAPATVPAGPSLSFDDRFAAAAPQSVEPAPQPSAEACRSPAPPQAPKPRKSPPQPQAAKRRAAEASKLAEAAKSRNAIAGAGSGCRDRARVAAPRRAAPTKTPGASIRDMAQRAKAAVMSIASNERQTIVEKLWGKPQPQSHASSLLAYASADASSTVASAPTRNPALAGNTPRYDQSTAVYDISAHMVYLPDGTRLEAHSGLGSSSTIRAPRTSGCAA